MHKKYLFGLLLFSLMILFSISQNSVPESTQIINAYKEADEVYRRALRINPESAQEEELESKLNRDALQRFLHIDKIIADHLSVTDSLRFTLSLKIAELAHYTDSLPLALRYYRQAIVLKSRLPAMADSFVFRPYLFSGQIYYYRNEFDSARFCFSQAEKIQNHYDRKLNESQRLYNNLGVLYFQAGNYKEASNYFQLAAQMLEKTDPYYIDFFVNYNINTAISLFKLDEFDKAERLLNVLLPYRKHLNEIYNNLGLIKEKQEKFEQAIHWFEKVHYDSPLDIGLLNDKAGAWLALGRYDSVQINLRSAYALHNHYYGNNSSIDHGLTFKTDGDLQKEKQNYLNALVLYQKAIHQFYPNYSDTSTSSNPTVFTGYFSYIHLFHTMVAKALTFHMLYQASHEPGWAQKELETYDACYGLIDYIERIYQNDEARLFLNKSKYQIRDQPIDIAFELYHRTKDNRFLEKAYELDQKSKASVLAFNEQRNQLLTDSSPLRRREQELKESITHLSLSATNLSTDSELTRINNQIRDQEIQLNKIQEKLAESSPSVRVIIPKIRDIQEHLLDRSTSLVSYHLGETKLTVYCISNTGFHSFQQNLYPGFLKDLDMLIKQLRSASDKIPGDSIRKRISTFLLKDLDIKDQSRMIIIPDDQLNYLPFETLVFENSYLVNRCSIQYQYSTSVLKKESTAFNKSSLVSFAPFTSQGYADKNLDLDPLPFSQQEISNLGGTSYIRQQATKNRFLEQAERSMIIHLATHAVAGDSTGYPSYIIFAPWNQNSENNFLLFSSEIYNLSLHHTKLIILSACETGTGPLIKGEGIMSLTRAFAYAGCPNIITSLWKADDESTAYITQKLHGYLQRGYALDRALQQAKKDYLADPHIHPRKKQPAYWAHLVFIGNYQPDKGKSFWWLVLAGSVMIVLLLWFLRKKTSKRAPEI